MFVAILSLYILVFFFFNDTATTEIYTLSLHDALPIWGSTHRSGRPKAAQRWRWCGGGRARHGHRSDSPRLEREHQHRDRKSTRLNSSHSQISYAVFCLKKKKKKKKKTQQYTNNINKQI